MRLYILVSFWASVATTTIRMFEMGLRDWPYNREPKSLGEHIMQTLIGIAILVWGGIILFVQE